MYAKTIEPDGNLRIELGDEKEITFTTFYTRKSVNPGGCQDSFAGDLE